MKKLIITKEQYNTLIKAGLIKESYTSMVKGGPNRVQKEFNKQFAGVTEDELNIKASNTGSGITSAQNKPLKAHKPIQRISENEKGGSDKISKEIKDLLKHLYGDSSQFNSDYWVGEKGKTCQEIEEMLTDKGYIVKRGRNYIVPKSLGTKEEAKEAIEESMREFVGEPKKEIDEDLDTNDTYSTNNPINQKEPEPIENRTDYDIFEFNRDIAILNQGPEFFILDFDDNNVNYEGREMSEDDINLFLNNNMKELPSILMPLDSILIDELGEIYNLNPNFIKKLEQIKTILNGVNEGLQDFSNEYPEQSPEEIARLKRKIEDIRAKELASRPQMRSKHPLDEPKEREYNPNQTELELDETGCASAMGTFSPIVPIGTPIRRDIKTVYESNVASTGNFIYDNPGLANVGRNGEFKKGGEKPKAFKEPQYPGGGIVKQPKCSEPNNNKDAQRGGCNSGASSLKMEKPSGSIITPSLGENKIFEEIAKRTGKTIEEVKQIISNKK
jgi:hypothetical protein